MVTTSWAAAEDERHIPHRVLVDTQVLPGSQVIEPAGDPELTVPGEVAAERRAVGGRPRRPIAEGRPCVVARMAERGVVRPADGAARRGFYSVPSRLIAREEVGQLEELGPIERQRGLPRRLEVGRQLKPARGCGRIDGLLLGDPIEDGQQVFVVGRLSDVEGEKLVSNLRIPAELERELRPSTELPGGCLYRPPNRPEQIWMPLKIASDLFRLVNNHLTERELCQERSDRPWGARLVS